MLRDFIRTDDISLISDVLKRFNFNVNDDNFELSVADFEALEPDSFLFTLYINEELYYMYAEDYVPSLQYIKEELNAVIQNEQWDFVIPKANLQFESSSPFLTAEIYEKPADSKEIAKYAVDSGYDFVFLAKVNEQA